MSGKRGFTLIELLVVLAIIGVLLAIAAPRYFSSVDRSKDAVLRSNLHQMREAIQQYYADKGKYPENLGPMLAKELTIAETLAGFYRLGAAAGSGFGAFETWPISPRRIRHCC